MLRISSTLISLQIVSNRSVWFDEPTEYGELILEFSIGHMGKPTGWEAYDMILIHWDAIRLGNQETNR